MDIRRSSAALSALSAERSAPSELSIILDGELLAHDPADPMRALPFAALQRRLGRKEPDAAVLAEVPAQFVAYDALAWDGALIVEEPYEARRARLAALDWPMPHARLAPQRLLSSAEEIETAFLESRAAGNEGLIAKALGSPYTPGRRGKLWIKLKKALATLDVVIVGAEWGHGAAPRCSPTTPSPCAPLMRTRRC
jgi:DNA ligase-1